MDSAGGESRLPGHRSNPLACVPHAFWLGTVLRVQAYRFVLRPDGAQERLLRRYVFNRALALQKERYAAGGKHLSYADLCRHLTACKAEPDTSWLKEVHSQVLQQALKDLDRAYRNFFEGRAEFPKFKRKGKNDAFRHPRKVELDQPNGRIRMPKLGWMRCRASRAVEGEVGQVTVSLKAGKWHVSVQTEREVERPVHPSTTLVGIDVGVTRFATLSDGTVIEPANAFSSPRRRSRRRSGRWAARPSSAATGGRRRYNGSRRASPTSAPTSCTRPRRPSARTTRWSASRTWTCGR